MLKNIGKRLFAMFGIPEGLASNGGLEFTSYDANSTALTKGPSAKLLSCLSTQQLPYRVCCENNQTYDQEYSGSGGVLDVVTFQRDIRQYHNTPDQHTKLSLAIIRFSKLIKDSIPALPGKYQPRITWRETLEDREQALRSRQRISEHTKCLPPLVVTILSSRC